MITKNEFDRVQEFLGKSAKPRAHEHTFAFTGLIKCGSCGASITAEEKIKKQQNGNVHHYVYYRCTKSKDARCPERPVPLKALTAQIDKLLSRLRIASC